MMTFLLLLQDVNREFEGWKNRKPGTRVTFVSSAKIDGRPVGDKPVEKTSTLVRVSAKEVEVEETNSVGAPPGETILTAAPPERERGEREAGRGKETVQAAGKDLPCEWFEWTLEK